MTWISKVPGYTNCTSCGSKSHVSSFSSDGTKRWAVYRCPNPDCPAIDDRSSGLFIGWEEKKVVGSEEHTICKTCKTVLVTKKIDVY